MFTGIIREVGVVKALTLTDAGARITVAAPRSRGKLVKGGSIAVDGVCLTATDLGPDTFAADAIPETLRCTRLGDLAPGARVNLELPLRAGDLLDGHIVQGHVDGRGEVTETRDEGTQRWVIIRTEPELARFFAFKGSVAVNGVSLTVAEVTRDTFAVALIPTTLVETNLDELCRGTRVNLEVDVLARYVARLEETKS